jgi:hypothetical protein
MEPALAGQATLMTSRRVPGFKPSASGLHFGNLFPHAPVLRIPLPPFGSLPVGDAAGGLCGGMIFAARDYYEAGLSPPADTAPPPHGSPLFNYLVRRLFASFNLPGGPIKYFAWMNLLDQDGRGARGVVWRTIRREWPRVRADLDGGKLSPLGLVRVHSPNPWQLGKNHQALAYGYDLDEPSGQVTILVYDPNHPDRDDVTITFTLRRGVLPSLPIYSTGAPLRGFFRTRYSRSSPYPTGKTGTKIGECA